GPAGPCDELEPRAVRLQPPRDAIRAERGVLLHAPAGGPVGMPITVIRIHSPLGELVLTESETALTGVYFPASHFVPPLHEVARGPGGEAPGGEVLARVRQQLAEYFARTG